MGHATFGVTPWQVVDPGDFVFAPSNPEIEAGCAAGLRAAFSEAAAIDLLEQQRAMTTAGGAPFCTVGGFVQLTSITREAITTKIIHRWPDEIGEQIKL